MQFTFRVFFILTFVLTSVALSPTTAQRAQATIHGEDDRKNLFEEPNSTLRAFASSVAVSVHRVMLSSAGAIQGQYMGTTPFGLKNPPSYNEWKLCPDQRFSTEFTLGAGGCAGFLVGPDLLLTAGHCYRDGWEKNPTPAEQQATIQRKCQQGNEVWVFDAFAGTASDLEYLKNGSNGAFPGISKKQYEFGKQIFECKEVLYLSPRGGASSKLGETFEDYALVRLKSAPAGRKVFSISQKTPDLSTRLGVLGFPQHLMMKTVSQGKATRLDSSRYFLSNLDIFVGNSGAPVMDLKTGAVVGIAIGALTSSKNELITDPVHECNRLSPLPDSPGTAIILRTNVFQAELKKALSLP